MKINKSYIVASALIASTSVLPLANNVSQVDAASKTVTVTGRVNFRKGPSTDYSVMRKLYKGYKLTYLGKSGRWVKVKYDGRTGYVYNKYVSGVKTSGSTGQQSDNTSVSASSVVSFAKSKLGKPYVWGAQGPNSFDCSGFTYYVFKNKAGITLPRNSSAQSTYGKYVKKSELRAGDLVFFDTSGANNGAVSHVGLYIGDGKMIHASYSQKKIVIDNFNSSYYQKAYVNARRVL